jgi:hypothetical protein
MAPKIAHLIAKQRDSSPFHRPAIQVAPESLNALFPNAQSEVLKILRSEGMSRDDEEGAYMVDVANAGFALLANSKEPSDKSHCQPAS